jgi:hypothetical protein
MRRYTGRVKKTVPQGQVRINADLGKFSDKSCGFLLNLPSLFELPPSPSYGGQDGGQELGDFGSGGIYNFLLNIYYWELRCGEIWR